MTKILNTIGDVYSPAAKEILGAFAEVDYQTPTQRELNEIIADYDAAVIGLGLTFDRSVIERGQNLKAIATATTGLDHVDLDAAKERGIEVLSLRGETEFLNTITGTAELAFGLMLDLMRGISPAAESVKQYEWDRERFRGREAKGKTLGVIGLGRLGRMMARYGAAFGMRVMAHDPHIDSAAFDDVGAESVSFDALVESSDVLSIHVHLSDDTESMFDAEVFGRMKPSAHLVNTARGKIVNEADVLTALQEKKIAGYATDVLDGELHFHESFTNHPLVEYAKTHSNCLITPHIGGMTEESRDATDVFIAEKLKRWFE